MRVAAIMPCRGRADQTVRNVRRLLATAGYSDWQLICVGAEHESRLLQQCAELGATIRHAPHRQRLTYWEALTLGADPLSRNTTLFANLANDLLPGQHWLQRAVAAYQATFGDGPGLLGFNDGHHETGHSCHFLISRALLDDYGGWPIWYDHAYGDTELCQRAIADGLYAKAPWATLYHDHPFFGGDDDAVYAEGRAKVDQDHALYERRRMNGWKS
jgi:hypothetical protein